MLKTIEHTHIEHLKKITGKVRDVYEYNGNLLIVTTDRLSAFDKQITTIPFKGQVLNLLSAFWFERLKAIAPNHMLSLIGANAMLVKKTKPLPIEFVVRGYLTGTTCTSIWNLYQQGERHFGGITLPDGLKKNTKLPKPIVTPTTKGFHSDKPITREDIISQNLMSLSHWQEAERMVLSIFDHASRFVNERGLILVDTKFELGFDSDNRLMLIDEVLTPDSSRYWDKSTYQERRDLNQEPDNFDKEMLRIWYKNNSLPYEDALLPEAPMDLRLKLSKLYITLYEKITHQTFDRTQNVIDEDITDISTFITG